MAKNNTKKEVEESAEPSAASTFYIVDGSSYIFRAYYAVAPLTSSKGLPTNALYGFCRMLHKLLKEGRAEHIAVTFDTGQPTFRHAFYDEYKANRSECPDDLIPQMPYFRKVIEALGLASLELAGFEADDIIATLVSQYSDKFEKTVIVTGDKDLTQLVTDKIHVWDAMRDIIYDEEKVQEKFGVRPNQIRDYLALRGDSSDNIPGVKGIGEKSAAALLQNLDSIDNLMKNLSSINDIEGLRGKSSIIKKLEAGKEQLDLSYKLVGLEDEVPGFEVKEAFQDFYWDGPRMEELSSLYSELDFEKLLSDAPLFGAAGAPASAKKKDILADKSFQLIDKKSFPSFLKKLKKQKLFAFDTEATCLDVLEAKLIGISFSWKGGEAYFLPFYSKAQPSEVLGEGELAEVKAIFADSTVLKIAHNIKYDNHVLKNHQIEVSGKLFDTLIAAHLIEPDGRGFGLKNLTKIHFDEEMADYKEVLGEAADMSELSLDVLSNYAGYDAEATFRLYEKFEKGLSEENLTKAFFEIEAPLIPVLAEIERNGIKVDVEYLESLNSKFAKELVRLEKEIHEHAGGEFNLNSPKQLSEVLFERLGIPVKGVKKTKSGYSTDASVLKKIAPYNEIVELIIDYRELFKLSSTYVQALLKLAKSKTSRIHSTFNQAITATGRLSSSDPNLQNIPIRTDRGRQLRKAFVAKKGFKLISADYSQIELRVLAHLSSDKTLIASFKDGNDIHLQTAKDIFGELIDDDELKKLRRVAKTINFGIIYGISAFRLAKQLKVSNRQAQDYIDGYFRRYSGVKEYFNKLEFELENKGYAETFFGRRRYLSQINSSGRDRGYAKRSLLNAPIQGTAAEIIKLAMVRLSDSLKPISNDAKMVLQVHDELVVEAREEISDEVEKTVVSSMEGAIELKVPLEVDVSSSTSWDK